LVQIAAVQRRIGPDRWSELSRSSAGLVHAVVSALFRTAVLGRVGQLGERTRPGARCAAIGVAADADDLLSALTMGHHTEG
jgi:hypothetical protein